MSKNGRNEECTCGSGKKYKKCGYLRTEEHSGLLEKKRRDDEAAFRQVGEMIAQGKLPFRAEIRSEGGTPSSMTLSRATITNELGVHKVFEDEIELSVGGDGPSVAIFEVPVQTEKPGLINTIGDAKVTNQSGYFDVRINGAKKISIKSRNGIFASIKTQTQRNIDADVCHIFFGESGRIEAVGANGQKDRPHICLASTGTGLFRRLGSYKCSVATQSAYERRSKTLSVTSVHINIEDWAEQLEVSFEVDHSNREVRIKNARFVSS